MKRTLSLILALAMVMSLFTTVSFAAAAVKSGSRVASDGVTYTGYPVKYDKSKSKATVYWFGSELKNEDLTLANFAVAHGEIDEDDYYLNDAKDKLTYYVGSAAYYMSIATKEIKVNLDAKAKTGYKVSADDDNKEFYVIGAAYDTLKYSDIIKGSASDNFTVVVSDSIVADNGAVIVDIKSGDTVCFDNADSGYKLKENYYLAETKEMNVPHSDYTYKKETVGLSLTGVTLSDFAEDPAGLPGGVTYDAENKKLVCTNASLVTEGTYKVIFTSGSYKIVLPLKVSKAKSDLTIEITNGGKGEYTDVKSGTLISKIATQIGQKNKVTAVTITAVEAADGITLYGGDGKVKDENELYDDNTVTLDSTDGSAAENKQYLTVKTTAGTIGELEVAYTTTVDEVTYSGTITFKSVYGTAVTDKQTAPFTKEEFRINSIDGIKYLDPDETATSFDSSDAEEDYNKDSTFNVDPSGHTESWKAEYTGYTSGKVAKLVTVTFTPVAYDILVPAVVDGAPFNLDMFSEFAEAVRAEQGVYNDVAVDHVEFPTVTDNKTWTLKKSGKKIGGSDEFTSSTIGSVVLDVTKAGNFDIPFRAYYDYKVSSGGSWSTSANQYYEGIVRVYAASEGDIKYEVSYGGSVNFKAADFTALYKKLASKKVLETVTIDDLPSFGTLYRNNKTTSAYDVDAGEVFYVEPTSANSGYDLSKVIFWAPKTISEEYSVFIPVTMNGTGGEKTAIVEIVINAGIPFADIAKTNTFYDYIEYCYQNGIMGGKSATNFDAKSSITRAQLVVTLYRMAGSPTTYNNKTLPFTDTTKLSSEFSNAVKWAYYNQIVGGTTSTTFAPNVAVTRQALVKIIHGYATAYGLDQGTVVGSYLGDFTDGASVSTSMRGAMNWALDYGLLSGNGSKLNPKGSTTRGAAAKILANFHASFIG